MGEDTPQEVYDIVHPDHEIQTIHVCLDALTRHRLDEAAQRRVVSFLRARFAPTEDPR